MTSRRGPHALLVFGVLGLAAAAGVALQPAWRNAHHHARCSRMRSAVSWRNGAGRSSSCTR